MTLWEIYHHKLARYKALRELREYKKRHPVKVTLKQLAPTPKPGECEYCGLLYEQPCRVKFCSPRCARLEDKLLREMMKMRKSKPGAIEPRQHTSPIATPDAPSSVATTIGKDRSHAWRHKALSFGRMTAGSVRPKSDL